MIGVPLLFTNVPVSSLDYWFDEILWIFLLCLNVVVHFISSGVCKPHPYYWLPRIFWKLKLLKIPIRLPQMKYEFWNFLGIYFTNFKWTPSIEMFIIINVVHINTKFLFPIMLFEWDIKRPHEISNHLSYLSNLWICRIFPWIMGFCGGFLNKVPSEVICPFFTQFILCIVRIYHW